jgi:hypothetical protein
MIIEWICDGQIRDTHHEVRMFYTNLRFSSFSGPNPIEFD